MRLGLLSDIHANQLALEACLDALEKAGVDGLACLGDLVGYGPDPQACIDLVRERVSACVLGNHDAAVAGGEGLETFTDLAHETALWTRTQLTPEALRYLEALPRAMVVADATLAHGAPEDIHRYLFGAREITEVVLAAETRFVACGHTHAPLVQSVDRGEVLTVRTFPQTRRVALPASGSAFVNPGSVGQPRDGVALAACAILDTTAPAVELLRVDYDIIEVCRRMRARGLPARLSLRLHQGI